MNEAQFVELQERVSNIQESVYWKGSKLVQLFDLFKPNPSRQILGRLNLDSLKTVHSKLERHISLFADVLRKVSSEINRLEQLKIKQETAPVSFNDLTPINSDETIEIHSNDGEEMETGQQMENEEMKHEMNKALSDFLDIQYSNQEESPALRFNHPERRFKCDFKGCGYSTDRPCYFTVHKRKHTGEKPFTCTQENCE